MKTQRQIIKKYTSLVNKFNDERDKKCYENMGEAYIDALNDFIGDYYSYGYADRMAITELKDSLFDIVTQ